MAIVLLLSYLLSSEKELKQLAVEMAVNLSARNGGTLHNDLFY